MLDWKSTHQQARLEEKLDDGVVRCHLSPRNCKIRDGKLGFCKVRGNVGGRLVTYNFGKGVHITEEVIETEAVNHYAPGARILSLGNIGCMLNCGYCQNWKTSQAKYVENSDVYLYTPEQVVETAKRHDIRMLSWTYNDPVVWHEFILATAKLAQQEGILNLYKSAFFITPEAIDELLPVIDIFSVSIKAIDDVYYRKVTTGWLEPVLEGVKQVHRAGKHVELSNLMVTDLSDSEESARKMADFVLTELDASVPLHFVRFHPDYRMRDTIRTPIPRLLRAQEVAREMGVEHVYLGNVYDSKATDTNCNDCNNLLVTRFGLNAKILGLDEKGCCKNCGKDAHFVLNDANKGSHQFVDELPDENLTTNSFDWRGDVCSLHVQILNTHQDTINIYHRRRMKDGGTTQWEVANLAVGESYRFILSKSCDEEVGPEVALPPTAKSNLHEVFDRAHFPTVSLEAEKAPDDKTPMPFFPGNQQSIEKLITKSTPV